MKPQFCILRTQKLKTRNDFVSSVRHHFRIGGLANCNKELTHLNYTAGMTAEDCIGRFQSFFNAGGKFFKGRRKDAVLAIEYLVTASPEFFVGKSREEVKEYLKNASDYLKNKHGTENVLLETWEFDETTPHLSLIVVPVDEKGKLNAKSFLGGPDKLRRLQTDFYNEVGRKHGLSRGIERNDERAEHKTVKTYYQELNALKNEVLNDVDNVEMKTNFEKRMLFYGLSSDVSLLKDDISHLKQSLEIEKELNESVIAVRDGLADRLVGLVDSIDKNDGVGHWRDKSVEFLEYVTDSKFSEIYYNRLNRLRKIEQSKNDIFKM